ncbi:hypothetical protein K438DRAFT_1777813 [Mycena galopus ATCC 62051]|nr:hypothetical protein K438DRAFT_1777813 [Mycena galopus ATCC 62051]
MHPMEFRDPLFPASTRIPQEDRHWEKPHSPTVSPTHSRMHPMEFRVPLFPASPHIPQQDRHWEKPHSPTGGLKRSKMHPMEFGHPLSPASPRILQQYLHQEKPHPPTGGLMHSREYECRDMGNVAGMVTIQFEGVGLRNISEPPVHRGGRQLRVTR